MNRPIPIKVNASAWGQICDASDRLVAIADEILLSLERLDLARGRGRSRAARLVRFARRDHAALCRLVGSLLVSAELPEGVGFVANGLIVWHTTDFAGNTVLGYVTASTIDPIPGY